MSLTVINTCYDHIDRYEGPSSMFQVPHSQFKTKIQLQSDNCKGRQTVKLTNSRDMLTRIETQTANNSAEIRRNKIHAETIDV